MREGINLKQSATDPCIFYKQWGGKILIIVLYVDDTVCAGERKLVLYVDDTLCAGERKQVEWLIRRLRRKPR
jgi:hypothetical protein